MNTQTSARGIGFAGALTLLFIGLKLAGFIGWAWWWVLAPAWIPAVVVALLLNACVVVLALVEFKHYRLRRRRLRIRANEHGPARKWPR